MVTKRFSIMQRNWFGRRLRRISAIHARRRMTQIRDAIIQVDNGEPKSDRPEDFDRTFTEQWRGAESEGHKQLGERYDFVEMGDEATVDGLMEHLAVQWRLDAMIEKCVKRLLLVRGLKSMSLAPSSSPPERLPDPSKVE